MGAQGFCLAPPVSSPGNDCAVLANGSVPLAGADAMMDAGIRPSLVVGQLEGQTLGAAGK